MAEILRGHTLSPSGQGMGSPYSQAPSPTPHPPRPRAGVKKEGGCRWKPPKTRAHEPVRREAESHSPGGAGKRWQDDSVDQVEATCVGHWGCWASPSLPQPFSFSDDTESMCHLSKVPGSKRQNPDLGSRGRFPGPGHSLGPQHGLQGGVLVRGYTNAPSGPVSRTVHRLGVLVCIMRVKMLPLGATGSPRKGGHSRS